MDNELKYANNFWMAVNDFGDEICISFVQKTPVFKEDEQGNVVIVSQDIKEVAKVVMPRKMAIQLYDAINGLLNPQNQE